MGTFFNRMTNKDLIPPQRIAVLIDGAFFLKRFFYQYDKQQSMTAKQVADAMYSMVHDHVRKRDILYRVFYYDCHPLSKTVCNPISHKNISYGKTNVFKFKKELLEELKKKRKMALRMGDLKDHSVWHLKLGLLKKLIDKKISVDDLAEDDVYLELKQQGIDMKIGVDIASMTYKKLVDKIVLFAGDSDFVPAAKLARREGIDFVLDPMNAPIDPSLNEHIDGIHYAKYRRQGKKSK